MKIFQRNVVIAGVALTCVVAGAQETGSWRAMSTTAVAITGDIAIANEKLAISFNPYTIAEIRALTQPEMNAIFGAESEQGSGHLYRLSVPATKRFLHKNTLCGSEETQWMATMVQGKSLQVAFFSGAKMPELTPEAVANSTDLCGTYSYVR